MTCGPLHDVARGLKRFYFPFDAREIPKNGIYFLFEKGEEGHGGERIVRVGTHTGEGQLASRLTQHFLTPNKDRSIFRKNIGRALLAREKDPFLADWEIDLTTRAARVLYGLRIDATRRTRVENAVSSVIQRNFSFAVIPVKNKKERLQLESGIISSISLCEDCGPSVTWLGRFSPKEKIRRSGLWVVNELYKKPLAEKDLIRLKAGML